MVTGFSARLDALDKPCIMKFPGRKLWQTPRTLGGAAGSPLQLLYFLSTQTEKANGFALVSTKWALKPASGAAKQKPCGWLRDPGMGRVLPSAP